MIKLVLACVMAMVFAPVSAFAYVGPGLGVGAIMSAIGVVVSIFAAVLGVLYYPIKRAIKNRKSGANSGRD